MLEKADFEKLIKKDISDETFFLYSKFYEFYYDYYIGCKDVDATIENFIKLLNVKAIPQDQQLKQNRDFAKKELPKLEKRLKDLNARKNDVEQTIKWLENQGSILTDSYRYEKLKIIKEIKKITSKIRKIKNSII